MPENTLDWSGRLTPENIDHVVKLLHQLLDGKKYTFIVRNEYFNFTREVRANQQLTPEKSTHGNAIVVQRYDDFATFIVVDSCGVWGCRTEPRRKRGYQEDFPFINFGRNKVTITHRAPAGYLLKWLIIVEK